MSPWTYNAEPAAVLYNKKLPLPTKASGLVVPSTTHDAAYWANATANVDFTSDDKMDFASYSQLLWEGLMNDQLYPATRSGADLRVNRAALLDKYYASLKK